MATAANEWTLSATLPSPAELNDLFARCRWQGELRTDARTAQYLHYAAAASSVSIDGQLVGFGKLSYDGYVAMLADLVVDPDHRRKGIASALIRDLLVRAEKELKAIATALLDQSGVAGFYEGFGFRPLGDNPRLLIRSNES